MARKKYSRKKYKNGVNLNATGYTKNTPTAENNYNLIPSNNITMDNTTGDLLAMPLDENGNVIGMEFMKQGKDYKFPNAESVLEVPQYQAGVDFMNMNPWTNLQQPPEYQGLPLRAGVTKEQVNSRVSSPYTMPNEAVYKNTGISYNTGEVDPNTVSQWELDEANATGDWLDKNIVSQDTTKVDDFISKNYENEMANYDPNQGINRDIQNPPKTQFFNPYGGVDIPTAANVLGQSIESGNTLGTVASSLKLVTGLGRNILGGIGQERQNQYGIQDYQDEQRRGMTQASYQDGGMAYNDVQNIKTSTGIGFEPTTVNRLFERIPEVSPSEVEVVKLGKYGDKNYFDVMSNKNNKVVLNPTANNPQSSENMNSYLPYLRDLNPGMDISFNYNARGNRMQEGGTNQYQGAGSETLPIEKIATGEYSGETPNTPNSEIEGGEYRKNPDGEVTEVLGKSHEQGGVPADLEQGTKILSDHTKLGADKAKMFREDFDLDIKAKDTYADVLDNFKKKSGLNKISKEIEDLTKKVEKETEKEDSATKEINLEFLSEKIKELEEKRKPLSAAKEQLFNKAFELQEGSKPKEEQTEEFKMGGVMDLAKQYGIEPERAKELIKKYQAGGFVQPGRGLSNVPEGQSINPQTGLAGNVDSNLYQIAQQRNPWFDFTNFNPQNQQQVLNYQKEFNKRSGSGIKLQEDGIFGEQTQSAVLGQQAIGITGSKQQGDLPQGAQITTSGTLNRPATITPQERQVIADKVAKGEPLTEQEKQKMNLLALPEQNPVMPGALQPVLKTERRYGRIDPTMVDPTQQLAEIDRSAQAVQSAVNQAPDASRNATLAQISTNTQQASNQAVAQANQTNAQRQQQADAFNIRQGDREQQASAQDALSYEQRMFGAMANTEADIRDYLETLQRQNLANYNKVNELNYLNQLSDNFQFTGSGFEQVGEFDPIEYARRVRLAQSGIIPTKTTTT